MTITESITKAMKDLGVPDCGISLDNPQPEKPEKKIVDKKKKHDIDMSKSMNPPVEDNEPDNNGSESEELTVFCKVHDGKMVLFFPKDYVFDVTNFGDVELNTLMFEAPDFNSTKLQELQITEQNQSEPKIVRVPIFLSPQEKAALQVYEGAEEPSEELEDLTEEKARLTEAIKVARESGDEDAVNELRKQRRVVRNKINKLTAGD